ncbi:MAG: PKD domain-containing protein, partial [Rhodospirillaceae bacterium]
KTINNHLLYSQFDPGEPVNSPPTADFTFDLAGLTANFTDASTDSDGSIAGWSWNFGDGSTSGGQNPSHTYAVAGEYSVTLTVKDDDGATGTATKSVTVSDDPTVEFKLSAALRKLGSMYYADLSWSGATGTDVDVFRNGEKLATTANDGNYTDKIGKKLVAYTYMVCNVGTTTCSNEAIIAF